jgi:hypothetical protein
MIVMIMFALFLSLLFLFGIGYLIVAVLDNVWERKRYKYYADRLDGIKKAGGRVTYSNFRTGTISYKKNRTHYSESLYRGYNSHCRIRRDENE